MTDFSPEYWMNFALEEALLALNEDEIPVGAVLVKNNQIILRNHNRTRQLQNPLAHAEKLIIDQAVLIDKYLYGYELYITLEPCLMCTGMIISSRIGKIVFGTSDPKTGACGSIYNALLDKSFNHHPILIKGILETECSQILKNFFALKRNL